MNGWWSKCWVGVVGALALNACAMEEPILRRDGGVTDTGVRPTDSGVNPTPDGGGGCAIAGQTRCGSNCVDTQVNASHCGMCNRACPSGQDCVSGNCTGGGTCTAPRMMCGASCVDVSSDNSNCGRCGNVCSAGQTCTSGACTGTMATARTGQPCSTEAECGMNSVGRGICMIANSGWPGGYCQYLCESDTDCGSGGRCALIEPVMTMSGTRNIGVCYTGCNVPGQTTGCRSGYVCLSAPEGGVCSPACNADPGACGANQCQASTGLCLNCNTSTDCNGNGTCTMGTCRCTASTTSCGPNRRCYTASGQCGCMNNQGCPAGWTCNTSTGQCAP
ncbi:MAG: hypothetical protein U0269_07275 [Polyangiales bacterium]